MRGQVAIADHVPLLCGQRWLLQVLLRQPSWARPVQRIYRLAPAVDTSALLEAIQTIVTRHPSLRLQLVETERGWRQRFPAVDADVAGVAVRGRGRRERTAYASHVLSSEGTEPFDLRRQPPFRFKLVEADSEYHLSICLDHLSADETAFNVFTADLADAYRHAVLGLPQSDWPAAAAFARCLDREIAQHTREPEHTEYWRRQLEGAPLEQLTTSSDDVEWVPGASHRWHIEGAALSEIAEACRRDRYSLFIALLSAQVRLLSALRHTDDIVVNVPVSNRLHVDDRRVIANLSMLLHVRFRRFNALSDRDFVRMVRDTVLEAMAHRQYDYARLADALALDAATRGGRIHWLTGCSYLEDRTTTDCDSVLAERLDDDVIAPAVPERACTFAFLHRGPRLEVTATWDPKSWPLDHASIADRFQEAVVR